MINENRKMRELAGLCEGMSSNMKKMDKYLDKPPSALKKYHDQEEGDPDDEEEYGYVEDGNTFFKSVPLKVFEKVGFTLKDLQALSKEGSSGIDVMQNKDKTWDVV